MVIIIFLLSVTAWVLVASYRSWESRVVAKPGGFMLLKTTKTYHDFKNAVGVGDASELQIAEFPAGTEILSVNVVVAERFITGAEYSPLFDVVVSVPNGKICPVALGSGRVDGTTGEEAQLTATNVFCDANANTALYLTGSKGMMENMESGKMSIFITYVVH